MKPNRLELIISALLIFLIAVGGFLSGNAMMAMGTAAEAPSSVEETPMPITSQGLDAYAESPSVDELSPEITPTLSPSLGGKRTPAPSIKPGKTTPSPSQPGKQGNPYRILVNKGTQVVTVYAQDAEGDYTVPVRNMACSTGRSSGYTPTGTFRIMAKYRWRPLNGGVYGQYASRVVGSILFHSVPYLRRSPDSLKWQEYNKLGSPASDGCIRLRCIDAKWIHDNCAVGTQVEIVNGGSYPGASSGVGVGKIGETGWDPTDPDPQNPHRGGTATPTPTPDATPVPTPTETPVPTPSDTPTPTSTPEPTSLPTPSPTSVPEETSSPEPTEIPAEK